MRKTVFDVDGHTRRVEGLVDGEFHHGEVEGVGAGDETGEVVDLGIEFVLRDDLVRPMRQGKKDSNGRL